MAEHLTGTCAGDRGASRGPRVAGSLGLSAAERAPGQARPRPGLRGRTMPCRCHRRRAAASERGREAGSRRFCPSPVVSGRREVEVFCLRHPWPPPDWGRPVRRAKAPCAALPRSHGPAWPELPATRCQGARSAPGGGRCGLSVPALYIKHCRASESLTGIRGSNHPQLGGAGGGRGSDSRGPLAAAHPSPSPMPADSALWSAVPQWSALLVAARASAGSRLSSSLVSRVRPSVRPSVCLFLSFTVSFS